MPRFFKDKNLPGQTFHLADDVMEELNNLHLKGIDINQLLREMLKHRQEKIVAEKKEISENIRPAPSRYIPVRIQKVVHEEYGNKCSIPTCRKPAEHLHHTQTFALSRQHDPHYLAPRHEHRECLSPFFLKRKTHSASCVSINLKVHEERSAVFADG
ncbi:hypothetical protein HZA41_01840 [Candidatus Peregrinibacteria bacterium]|nr:hypothetical protein [Candidatus Peregrinibacteria bacterium]